MTLCSRRPPGRPPGAFSFPVSENFILFSLVALTFVCIMTTDVEKIGMKIPQFSASHIKLYFAQLEANFAISKITEEATKFSYLVAAIDSEYLKYVSDIVYSPPADEPYTALKLKLLEQFEHSETKKLNTLLQDLVICIGFLF